ncbi:hypothetical protein D9757_008470 [Collybiopsis confluens]|uniref:Xylanolytic transcriptional activator regulatory domain-containing protein n=1 Tax=Collybiopsis confluens TaxID=2823264 RepID=A0A8H5M5T4_9AGAR|nr:hypothetical protein D9757_008470 [Collybiopsis confluens]
MTPSVVVSPSGHTIDRYEDDRPTKRPRTDSMILVEEIRHSPPSTSAAAPDQHVFISESTLATKKQSGKKPPLSCCECRRLKLRVSLFRSFLEVSDHNSNTTKVRSNFSMVGIYVASLLPAPHPLVSPIFSGSCKKRGVSDICPDGVLVSGKGTRFILANTEQLHSKIQDMSEHIRRLEEALEHSSNPSNPHPLLQPEMLNVKSTMELYGVAVPKNGPGSALPVSSERTFNHDTLMDDSERKFDGNVAAGKRLRESKMEAEIDRLSSAFPQGDGRTSSGPNIQLREYLRSQLPRERLAHISGNSCGIMQPGHITFFPNIIHHCYSTVTEELSPRRLALLFMILAIGSIVDLARPLDPSDSEKYHGLGRAALCEISLLEDTTLETITALYYDLWYLLVFSDKKQGLTQAWAIMGLTTKLAQSIGLHRNGVKSKVIPEEVEKRRNLFWELSYLDARLALSLGRPPSLSIKYTDCPHPSYIPEVDHLESSHHYYTWNHSFYIECLYPIVDALSQPGIEYSTIISLDTMVRNFPVPPSLRLSNPKSRSLLLQQVGFTVAYESAISGPEEAFNKRHRYAPSVVAVWLGAVRMIAAVQRLYRQEPELSERITGWWSNVFSAVIAIALLVSRAPFTCLSPAGVQELERARLMFKSQTCARADRIVPMLDTIIAKANNIFKRWYHGQEVPTVVLRHEEGHGHDPFIDQFIKMDSNNRRFVPAPSPPPTDDSFKNAHPVLTQCIAEAHARASIMFPMRKPCQCSNVKMMKKKEPVGRFGSGSSSSPSPSPSSSSSLTCPPSHSWTPAPAMDVGGSDQLLPDVYPDIANPLKFNDAPSVMSNRPPFYHSVNFELGAFEPNMEHGWMGWF